MSLIAYNNYKVKQTSKQKREYSEEENKVNFSMLTIILLCQP